VVSGRCLPYGEGITYLPVVEVVRQLDSLPSDPAAAHPLRSLLRETDESTSPEQIGWGFRKLIEEQAPLVCLFDDIQWGEETFLDLVDATALLASGPILMLCLARPDLVEHRPQWPVALRLEPLADDDVESLIRGAVADELRHKILRAAGGNPLFATEMVALAREVQGDVSVPPTLQALLAARLDQLDPAERSALESGAVEGEIFHRGAVQALVRDDHVTPQLAALVRKQLIRPHQAQLLGDDAFRFRHLLIRDAAYEALPKAMRAELHERVADWLEERGQDLVELNELLGHHLEQAVRYQAELGRRDPKLAARAGERLAAAGRRALDRADYPAAGSLLARAVSLLPPERRERAVLLPDLAAALVETGEPDDAASVLEEARSAADVLSDQGLAARESVVRCHFQRQYAPDRFVEEARRDMPRAIETFAGLGDDLGVAQASRALGMSHFDRLQFDAAEEAFRRGAAHARLARNRGEEAANIGQTIAATIHGPTPVAEALPRLDQLLADRNATHGEFVPWWLGIGWICRGVFAAMSGRFDEGRALVAEARSSAEALGSDVRAAGWARHAGRIELLADDPIGAERELRPAYERLAATREKGWRASVAFLLAEALWRQRRAEEALEFCDISREIGGPEDLQAQIGWRSVRAKVLAGGGEIEKAERLAREAVALAAETDALTMRGDALTALAEVLVLANRTEEAAQCLGYAHDLHEAKGDAVSARRVRASLEESRRAAPRT
jgi:tetratricopeptide (TPR) repeat protein